VVVKCGPGVKSLKPGDHVIPLTPRMPRMPVLPVAQDQPLHRDPRDAGPGADARRHHALLDAGWHADLSLHGLLDLANHTVLPEIALAKVRDDAPFDKICYIGCGVTTGIGAVLNTAKVEQARPRWSSGWAASAERDPGPEAGRRRHDHRRRL
jgi:S-(hydroxymethyl)glutathione dehydrogenase/alcohol dehydrogenase